MAVTWPWVTCRRYINTVGDRQAIKITEDCFKSVSGRPVLCIVWDLPRVKDYNFHRPDILHNIYMKPFNHLITWIVGFLQCQGKPRYLMRSWLAFLYTLISITVAKPAGKFGIALVKRCEVSGESSTWHPPQHCTTHYLVTVRSSRKNCPEFGHSSTGVLWYNTEPTQHILSTN